jgi:hypothetical protein
VQPDSIVIPDHSHYKGMNDRFALAAPAVAYNYGQRLNFTLANCEAVPIHAEYYAKWWAQLCGYSVIKMPRFDFFRVRATGFVAVGDAMALRGCNMSEMYHFPVQASYVRAVRMHRRAVFREGSGWSALPTPTFLPAAMLGTVQQPAIGS